MMETVLDETTLESAGQAHARIAVDLQFPDYYGANLSALSDCLEDLCEPARIVLRRIPDDGGRKEWFDGFERVIARCAAENPCIDVIEYDDDIEGERPDCDHGAGITPQEALERLERGNRAFLTAHANPADISPALVEHLFEEGQQPFACIITCSDSRVAPEHVFCCGLGELFAIRTAGNVVGPLERASALYACGHLHTRLLVVLGHTHCGAIESAMDGAGHGGLAQLVGCVADAIGDERDPYAASVLNVRAGLDALRADEELAALEDAGKLRICGAVYHTATGVVDFL